MSADDPWDRRPGEGAKPYEAFRTYRDLGTARSLSEVARRLDKSKQLLARWSSAYSWVTRCEAWDREQDRQWQLELAAKRREMAARHARIGAGAISVVESWVQSTSILDAEKLSVSDLARLLTAGAKVERDALGEPERHEHSGPGGGPIPVDLGSLTQEDRQARLDQLQREIARRLKEGRGQQDEGDIENDTTDESLEASA